MALAIAQPTGAVTHLPGFLTVVRLKDFVGAARGTLDVVADALSVGGDVVTEEQTLTPPHDNTDYQALLVDADPTIVLPFADLGLQAGIFYSTWLSLRAEGDTPTDSRLGEGWASMNGVMPLVGRYNDSDGPDEYKNKVLGSIPRKATQHYMLSWFNYVSLRLIDEGTDSIIIKAVCPSGGDIKIFLDCMYLLPYDTYNNPDWPYNNPAFPPYSDASFRQLADLTGFRSLDYYNGQVEGGWHLGDARDSEPVSWLGNHSVMLASGQDFGTGWGGTVVDFQQAEDEPTGMDLNQSSYGGSNDWDAGDPASILMVTAGVVWRDTHTIESDGFGRTTTDGTLGLSPYPYKWDSLAMDFTSFQCDGSKAVCAGVTNTSGSDKLAVARFGYALSTSAYYDDHWAECRGMWSWQQKVLVEFTATPGADVDVMVGVNVAGGYSSYASDWVAGVLTLTSAGAIKASLVSKRANPSTAKVFGAVTTIDAGPISPASDKYWVKVQRDLYRWRIRVWKDGDTEPTTWDLDELEPAVAAKGSYPAYATREWIDHPYDTNFDALSNTGYFMQYDPMVQGEGDSACMLGVRCPTGQSTALDVKFDDYELSYQGGGDPVSGFLSIYEYNTPDVLILSGVELPYGSQYVVYAEDAKITFDGNTRGYSPYGWNDTGAPDRQGIAVCDFFETCTYSLSRPQIYRLIP